MEFVSIKGVGKRCVNPERLSLDLNGLGIKKIQDINGLQDLTKRHRLELQGNKLISIEGLENLRDLEELFLSGNKIIRIENLNKLPYLIYRD